MANFEFKSKITSFKVKDTTNTIKSVRPIRTDVLQGKTYKTKIQGKSSLYVTINDLDSKPFEIFINSRDNEHFQWITALTRVMSAVFRTSDDVAFLVKELKAVVDPNGGFWKDGKYVPSIVAEIGNVLSQHLSIPKENKSIVEPIQKPQGTLCPECGEYSVRKIDGCTQCTKCAYKGECG